MTTIPADKLDKLIARWQSVQATLASGMDQENYVRLSREFAELDPIVTTINTLRSTVREVEELKQLIDDPKSDPEMAALAEEEAVRIEPDPKGPYPHGLHHFVPFGELTVIDGKRQRFGPGTAARWLSWRLRSRSAR